MKLVSAESLIIMSTKVKRKLSLRMKLHTRTELRLS